MAMDAWERPAGRNPLTPAYWLGRIDLRPIALFRIAIGLFVVYDLFDFAPNLRAWFSDEGVLPRAALLSSWARASRFCVFDAFGSPALVWVYWGIALAAALAMTVGYRSRLASIATFVLMAGFQERLPPLFDGADSVLRLVLFWHMFTSSGRVWSFDAALARARGKPLVEAGPALSVRLVQLQVAWVYFCSVFYKSLGQTWHDGTAVHYGMHLSHVFARPWAASIADSLPLVKFATYFTLFIEAGFIFFINSPVLHRPLKAMALLMGTALHMGIFATINVGHFSFLMPTTYLAMLEPEWAQRVADWISSRVEPAMVERWRCTLLRLPASPSLPRFAEAWAGRLRPASNGLLAAAFVASSWYALPRSMVIPLPRPVESAVQWASLWSTWDMFAPEPLRTDYRLSGSAELEDGSAVDLDLFGGPPGGPGDVRGFFFTRWWKYMENVTGGDKTLPLEWGRFLCREHNYSLAPGMPRLYTFALYKDNQIIPPIGQPWPPVQRQTVWTHRCFDRAEPPSRGGRPQHIAVETPAH